MTTEDILRMVPCGACGLPILGTGINIVATGRRARWEFPSMGNVLTGKNGEAVAFLCAHCIRDQAPPLEAVEFIGQTEYRTHALRTLEPYEAAPAEPWPTTPTPEERRRVDLCLEWALSPEQANAVYQELAPMMPQTSVWFDFERQVQEVLAKEILRLRRDDVIT